MKILIVMGGFFPGEKYGGPPVSIDNFCSLMKEYACYIVTHDHDLFEAERFTGIQYGWNDRGNCKVRYLPDSEYNKTTFEEVMKEIKPDILYLQGLFQSCVVPCLQLAKKHNIHVLLAPRGELCTGALKKKYKKIPYIKALRIMGIVKNIHWQSTSDEETEAIKKWMKTDNAYIHCLDNIPTIPKKIYSKRAKTAGEGRFVFLSRIHSKKNLLLAIKYFHNVKGKVQFDIYGPIENEGYWRQCQEEIKRLPGNITVEYKGTVSHAQVHEVFSQYDAFLFPTFSENYGHVIAESMVAGTPVIISDRTPWRDLEKVGAGWDIVLSNTERFVEAISKIISMNEFEYGQLHQHTEKYINQKLDVQRLKEQYSLAIDKALCQ